MFPEILLHLHELNFMLLWEKVVAVLHYLWRLQSVLYSHLSP